MGVCQGRDLTKRLTYIVGRPEGLSWFAVDNILQDMGIDYVWNTYLGYYVGDRHKSFL